MSNKTPKKSVGELAVAATIPFSIKAKARFDMREKLDFRFTWHTYSGSPELTGIITGLHAYAHDMGIRLNDELLMRTLHTTFDGLRKDVRKKNPEVAVGKNATLAQKMEKKNALLELDQDNNEKKKVEGVQQTKESLVVNEDEGDTDDEEDKEPGSDKDPDGEDGDEEELEKEKKTEEGSREEEEGRHKNTQQALTRSRGQQHEVQLALAGGISAKKSRDETIDACLVQGHYKSAGDVIIERRHDAYYADHSYEADRSIPREQQNQCSVAEAQARSFKAITVTASRKTSSTQRGSSCRFHAERQGW